MKLAPGAWRWAVLPLALALPAFVVSPFAGGGAVALAAAVLAFHRDPDREPDGPGVLAPADGRVSVVREEGDRVRVGVFMNVTDVHVNRAPLAGRVTDVEHVPGGHRPAFTKDSERNERVHLGFEDRDYEVTLIAGTVARRVHPYVEPGDEVARGERVGHVSFGSRADVVLPADYGVGDLLVAEGDGVTAGETVVVPPLEG